MKDLTKDQALNLEAAKLLKEWSSWMVAVLSALIIAYLKHGDDWRSPECLPLSGKIAIFCFVVSMLTAAWVLSAIPYVVICLSSKAEPNIYQMPLTSLPLLEGVKLWQMAMLQHWGFGLGVGFLLIGYLFGN